MLVCVHPAVPSAVDMAVVLLVWRIFNREFGELCEFGEQKIIVAGV